MHVYLGALVSGAVLLAVAILVDDGSRSRRVSLRSIALTIAVFGMSSVSLEALGLTQSATSTLALATCVGLGAASGLWLLARRERAQS